jgi:gliotoxin/aspirochlorine biosynthesis aminotransferase
VPIGVDIEEFEDSFGLAMLDKLENAIHASDRKVRALAISNPHNPLGRSYSVDLLQRLAQLCEKHDIHLVSDEVFGLSQFESPDLPNATKYTSVLSLDTESLGVDPKRIHFVWSLSKDFAASGVRLVSVRLWYRRH